MSKRNHHWVALTDDERLLGVAKASDGQAARRMFEAAGFEVKWHMETLDRDTAMIVSCPNISDPAALAASHAELLQLIQHLVRHDRITFVGCSKSATKERIARAEEARK